jgi:drug/metabolite transporter (DMT)-like permease
VERIERIRERYWCSSWLGFVGVVGVGFEVVVVVEEGLDEVMTGSTPVEDMLAVIGMADWKFWVEV